MLIDKNVAPEGRQKWIDGNRKEHKQKRVYNKTHSGLFDGLVCFNNNKFWFPSTESWFTECP